MTGRAVTRRRSPAAASRRARRWAGPTGRTWRRRCAGCDGGVRHRAATCTPTRPAYVAAALGGAARAPGSGRLVYHSVASPYVPGDAAPPRQGRRARTSYGARARVDDPAAGRLPAEPRPSPDRRRALPRRTRRSASPTSPSWPARRARFDGCTTSCRRCGTSADVGATAGSDRVRAVMQARRDGARRTSLIVTADDQPAPVRPDAGCVIGASASTRERGSPPSWCSSGAGQGRVRRTSYVELAAADGRRSTHYAGPAPSELLAWVRFDPAACRRTCERDIDVADRRSRTGSSEVDRAAVARGRPGA